MYIDSHAHLTGETLIGECEAMLARAKKIGVGKVVNICTDLASLEKGLLLAGAHAGMVYNVAATTPHDVVSEGEEFFPVVAEAAREGKLVAVGETGLDYFYEHSDRGVQKRFLLKYFELALEVGLPLVFHCRDAFVDLFSLADVHYKNGSAVLHCFTGSLEEAREVIERGWYLSLSGIVTFKKSEALREIAKWVPLDRLLIETDAPFLAPQSKRGKTNEPAFILETASVIAQVKGLSLEKIAGETSENAKAFFSF